jgi:hypothetical protein
MLISYSLMPALKNAPNNNYKQKHEKVQKENTQNSHIFLVITSFRGLFKSAATNLKSA